MKSDRERVIVENQVHSHWSSVGSDSRLPPLHRITTNLRSTTSQNFADGVLSIDPNSSIEFTVSYHPTVEGRHPTAVVIESNDVDSPIFTIPITGQLSSPAFRSFLRTSVLVVVAEGIESARQVLNIVIVETCPQRGGVPYR